MASDLGLHCLPMSFLWDMSILNGLNPGIMAVQSSIKLTLKVPETKIAEFAKSIDLDEVAHYEPPHKDLHCLPLSL